ncbi:AMP-binding protein [Ekhidna sp.]|uniref:AMP-binding protein n=1 Tax=Ekhidna sp. TaxID=2608089 RepID=UPI003CCBCC5D
MQTFNTPLEAYHYWLDENPKAVFLRQPINREFIEYSREEAYKQARSIAAGLQEMGLKKGDHVAILSKNCAHWFMADLAIMLGGFISVPIYPTLDAASINEILVHSETKAVIIGKLDDYTSQQSGIPDIIKVGVELYDISEQHSWEDMITKGHSGFTPAVQDPEDLITIMYTSGTTGNPKGVMHKVKSFNIIASTGLEALEIPLNSKFFSYLPLSHIAERIGIEMGTFYKGGIASFPETLDTFAEDLANTSPDVFLAVPRIWGKFQEKILEKMPQQKLDKLLSLPIIGNIVKKKIRKKLGLNNATCFSGAAPLAISLQEWYAKLGIEIKQCYGMTEDCILSHFSLPNANKFGKVGRPLPGVQSKLSEEGEVLVKNDCLMVGYYKEPEKTAEMFTEDGYLRTGDIGEFDHDGYLSITGRIKDQFKTDKGKYVDPSGIELQISKNTDIEQICLVGMGIAQPMALVVPTEAAKSKSKEELNKSLLKTIDDLNPSLKAHEKVAKAVVMKEDWTVDNGLMTPSMKIRRNRVEAIHQEYYPQWFDMEERVVYEADI